MFPDAAQPDIVRASMKDSLYKKMFFGNAMDIVLRVMGTPKHNLSQNR